MIGLSYVPVGGSGAAALMAQALLWSTAVLLAAALAAGLMRKASAAVRSTVWGVALAALLVVPLLATGLPSWRVPTPTGLFPGQRAEEPARRDVIPGTDDSGLSTIGFAEDRPTRTVLRTTPATSSETVTRIPIGAVLGLLWLTGTAFTLGRFALHLARIAVISRRADAVTGLPEWSSAGEIAAALGIARPVSVLLSGEVSSPLSWGAVRPIVVLPADAASWPDARRSSVLLHELAHVARLDYVLHVAVEMTRAVYWANPLVWVAIRRYTAERERACDDVALSMGTPSRDYASHLLEVARDQVLGTRSVAVAAMAQHSSLKERLRFVMDGRISRAPITLRTLMLSGSLALALAVPVASMDLGDGPPHVDASRSRREFELDWSGGFSSGSARMGWSWTRIPGTRELERELLSSSDPDVRREAAWWLGEHESGRSVPELLRALEDPDPDVRLVAGWALGEIKDPASIPSLVWALDDSDPLVREMAVLALGEIEHPAAVDPLVDKVKAEPGLAQAVVWALGEIGDRDAERKRDAIIYSHGLDGRANQQVWTGRLPLWGVGDIWGLLRKPDRDKIDGHVRDLRTGDADERRDAALALGLLGNRDKIDTTAPLDSLLDALRDPVPEVRAMAVWSLDELNPSRSEHR